MTIVRDRINDVGRAPVKDAPTSTVGAIVGVYKSLCVNNCLQWIKINKPCMRLGKLWQRNYWEHIIRNENEYSRIAQYIEKNPAKWGNDKLNGGSGNTVMEQHTEYGVAHESWMV